MRIGYIIASNQVMKEGRRIGYLYREIPDNPDDSGWRVFSGQECQDYVDDPLNFAMYNASTVVDRDPDIAGLLATDYPVSFERDSTTGQFCRVDEEDQA